MLVEKQNLTDELKLLKKALESVKSEYFIFRYLNVAAGFQKPERVFVAELYHQIRVCQEQNGINNIIVHIEPNKQNLGQYNNECIRDFRPQRLSPDIVMHAGQDNKDHQNLVCEVKMEGASYKKIFLDIKKLMYYKLSRLDFENAVLVYTGSIDSLNVLLSRAENDFKECIARNKIVFATPKTKIVKNNGCYDWSILMYQNGN